ncbi:MAG: helix-turn-helix domain-containing protein [Alphaproteobacteria bacterium]|nr:helix-turn-helix domain-containing protein [Alphaproteobacteria bacterium]
MLTKHALLRTKGCLHLHPHTVADSLFQTYDFFDAHDLLQVKYEMLRRVHHDTWSITQACQTFGFSRPAFYQAQEAFEEQGFMGLIPHKRGPQTAHKLSPEVMAFIQEQQEANPQLSMFTIIKKIQEQFTISVHRRSVERALSKHQKKFFLSSRP